MKTYSLEDIIRQIEERENKLLPVKRPVDVIAGSTDVDDQLYRLAVNIEILTELKLLAGTEAISLEETYNRKVMKLAEEFTESRLKEMGIVRSDKFKYIKAVLHKELSELERMRIKYKYFQGMYDTYTEWINIYKKTRRESNTY